MVSGGAQFEGPRLLIVEFDRSPDPGRFTEVTRSIGPTHILFTDAGTPTDLATADMVQAAHAELSAVRSGSESLIPTESRVAGRVFYARSGVVLLREEVPFLIAPERPLIDAADVNAVLGEASMGVAASIRLPGPGEPPPDPVEVRRCPGPEPHWLAVRLSNPYCPDHHLYLA